MSAEALATNLQNTDKDSEKFKKRINNIKSAGQWARGMGWVLIAFSPIIFWSRDLIQDYSFIFYYLVLVVPLCIYLMISGKYIQYSIGSKTPYLLMLNSVIAIALMGGIVPIFLFFTSIGGFISYRNIRKNNELDLISKKKYRLSLIEILFLVSFTIFGSAFILMNATNTIDNPPSSSAANSFYNESLEPHKEFVSTEHRFRIKFKGSPSIDRTHLDINGYKVPYTSYDVSEGMISNMVTVADYGVISGEFDKIAGLEGMVNGIAGSSPGGRVINSSFGTFAGQDAIKATIALPYEGETYTAYFYGLFKEDSKVAFSIMSIGVSESEFNQFAESFSFNQSL